MPYTPIKFSEITTEGFVPSGMKAEDVIAHCLSDWATSMLQPPPPNFGKGMKAASKFLGIPAIPPKLMEAADEISKGRKK